jgi:serine/threonine protein kinase
MLLSVLRVTGNCHHNINGGIEIKILKSLDHPNIVKLHEVAVDNDKNGYVVVVRWCIGTTSHGSCMRYGLLTRIWRFSVFLVFEYVEHDLSRLVDTMRKPFSEVWCCFEYHQEAVTNTATDIDHPIRCSPKSNA